VGDDSSSIASGIVIVLRSIKEDGLQGVPTDPVGRRRTLSRSKLYPNVPKRQEGIGLSSWQLKTSGNSQEKAGRKLELFIMEGEKDQKSNIVGENHAQLRRAP